MKAEIKLDGSYHNFKGLKGFIDEIENAWLSFKPDFHDSRELTVEVILHLKSEEPKKKGGIK